MSWAKFTTHCFRLLVLTTALTVSVKLQLLINIQLSFGGCRSCNWGTVNKFSMILCIENEVAGSSKWSVNAIKHSNQNFCGYVQRQNQENVREKSFILKWIKTSQSFVNQNIPSIQLQIKMARKIQADNQKRVARELQTDSCSLKTETEPRNQRPRTSLDSPAHWGTFDKIKKIISEQSSSAFNKLPELCTVVSGRGNFSAITVLQGFSPCWELFILYQFKVTPSENT